MQGPWPVGAEELPFTKPRVIVMFKSGLAALLTSLIVLLAVVTTSSAQGPPRSGIYRIEKGLYREVGGFIGFVEYKLPNSSQTFALLTLEPGGTNADLQFLDQNRRGLYFPRLTNGIVSGNTIRFRYQTTHPYGSELPPADVDYAVTNNAGNLWISGSITSAPVCCDIPYQFEHIDVWATRAPTLTVRAASGIEICWSSETNQNYQVQYNSDLAGVDWLDVGGQVQGNGSQKCIVDSLGPGQLRRFYRVVLVP